MKVKRIEKVNYVGDVYNITVEDNHNYFADGVCVSNCHAAKSYEINLISKKCDNANHRIGLTGTMPKNNIDSMNIQSVLGQKIFDLKAKDLIEMGVLSKIQIANLVLKYPPEIIDKYKRVKYNDEISFLYSYFERNRIFNYIFNKIPDKQNSLILVRKIEHLKTIEKYLIDNLDDKYSVFVIWGKVKTKDREKIRLMMDKSENMIIISNYQCFKMGVNIKKLHNVILASSSKSEITIPQAIGRGLRTHEEKTKVIIWDIVDDLCYKKYKNYTYKHFLERLNLYNEYGYDFFTKDVKITEL